MAARRTIQLQSLADLASEVDRVLRRRCRRPRAAAGRLASCIGGPPDGTPHPAQALVSTIIGTLVLAGTGGCGVPDDRVGELASQVTHEQAEQNQRIAEGSKAIAQGSKQLVEADAQARRELIELQHSLRQDQAEIGQRQDALEAERKAIASQRRTESAILFWPSPDIALGLSCYRQ